MFILTIPKISAGQRTYIDAFRSIRYILFAMFMRLINSTLLVVIVCISCDVNTGPTRGGEEVAFKEMGSIPDVLAYQSVEFTGNNFPGTAQDYQVLFDDVDIPIESVMSSSLRVIVPLDVTPGIKKIRLFYKNEEYSLGKVNVVDWSNLFPADISFFETSDGEYPVQMLDSMQNKIIPHIKGGSIDKVYFQSGDGTSAVIYLNEIGLPAMIYSPAAAIMVDGYDLEKGLANLAMFSNDNFEEPTYSFGVELDAGELNRMVDQYSSINGRIGSGGRIKGEIADVVEAVTTVFGIAGCIVSFAPPLTPFGVAMGGLTCASSLYSAYRFFNPDSSPNAVDKVNSTFGGLSAAGNCAELVITKPKNAKQIYEGLYGCYQSILDGVSFVDTHYEEIVKSAQTALEKYRAILNTGYGDIKITLTWNTTSDLDLWVIEPSGEKIYFEHQYSATGGQLDLDDTDGFGPENVFWPVDSAPFGSYKVQVHFYGGQDSERPATYQVTIVNFGKIRNFSGVLTFNQVVTVSEFEADAWTGGPDGAGGRVTRPVSLLDRSNFPVKRH